MKRTLENREEIARIFETIAIKVLTQSNKQIEMEVLREKIEDAKQIADFKYDIIGGLFD